MKHLKNFHFRFIILPWLLFHPNIKNLKEIITDALESKLYTKKTLRRTFINPNKFATNK